MAKKITKSSDPRDAFQRALDVLATITDEKRELKGSVTIVVDNPKSPKKAKK